MDWKIYYKPKGDDLASVWVSADSSEEAIQKAKHEYWYRDSKVLKNDREAFFKDMKE